MGVLVEAVWEHPSLGLVRRAFQAADLPEILLQLERNAPQGGYLVGAYVSSWNVSLVPCGCAYGCPICDYTGVRVLEGPASLAPFREASADTPG